MCKETQKDLKEQADIEKIYNEYNLTHNQLRALIMEGMNNDSGYITEAEIRAQIERIQKTVK